MNWLKNFQSLPVCTINRICFYPVALAATQVISLVYYLSVPDADYLTPITVLSGLVLGGTIVGITELLNSFIARKERAQQETDKFIRYAANPRKSHLYVVELLADGEIVYRFASDFYKTRSNRNFPAELEGHKYSEYHTIEESKAYSEQLAGVIELGEAVEFESLSPNGRINIKNLTPHIDNETGRKFITSLSCNIRDLKETQQKFEYEAYHDALTGLPNRRLLDDRIKQAHSSLSRQLHDSESDICIVLFKMDLDNFKHNNDTYGHPLGDKLLISVANRLRLCVREMDTIVREGGDEFTLLLPKSSKAGAIIVAKKIITEINKPHNINKTEHHLGISIGISLYPQDGASFDVIHKKADEALYLAKARGRNSYHVYNESGD